MPRRLFLSVPQQIFGSSPPLPEFNKFFCSRETLPDWDKDIGEDVKGECSKFGAVNHIYVDRNSKVMRQVLPASLLTLSHKAL